MVVLHDSDVSDPTDMLTKLIMPPYLVSFNQAPNSFHRDVRQLFMQPNPGLAMKAPLAYKLLKRPVRQDGRRGCPSKHYTPPYDNILGGGTSSDHANQP